MILAYVIMHRQTHLYEHQDSQVYVAKVDKSFKLFRNGKPFYLKGASGSSFIKELADINGNTLRVYDTTNLAGKLDEAQRYHLAVIVDIPISGNTAGNFFYKSKANREKLKRQVKSFVKTYRDHPALLMWNLGNEILYPLNIRKNDFVATFNDLIDIIHEVDPNHPISTSVSGTSHSQTLGIHLFSPKLDIIAFNTFSSIKDVENLMFQISLVTNCKPYYISEWGTRGPWDQKTNLWKSLLELNSTEKSKEYRYYYEHFIKNNTDCLGSLAFYWGHKIEGTPSWFNIFDEHGNKSPIYYTLAQLWNGDSTFEMPIKETPNILIDGNFSTTPVCDSNALISLKLTEFKGSESIKRIKWSLYKEGWGRKEWHLDDLAECQDVNKVFDPATPVELLTPDEQGPYRLFVYLYDDDHNYVTTNLPLYIFNSENTLD